MGTEQPPAEGAAKLAQWSPKPMAPRFWGVLLMAWRFVRKCPREGWPPFFLSNTSYQMAMLLLSPDGKREPRETGFSITPVCIEH